MIPVLFRIGPFSIFNHQLALTIYSYGLMMALGFLAADYVIALECRRRHITVEYSSSIVVWAAIFGLVFARIYAILDDLPGYFAEPSAMIFSGSGFVWYGGLFGGILGTYIVSRYYKISWPITADMCSPALALGQAIGRIGCQVSGDGDWGLPSNVPWAMAYPRAIIGWNSSTVLKLDERWRLVSGYFPGVRVHPAPIYETFLYAGVFALLWSMRTRPQFEGRLLYMYLMTAGAARFLVEFVRINPRVLYCFTEAQLIALGMVAVGGGAWYLTGERHHAEVAPQHAVRA